MPLARNSDSSFQNSRRETGSTPVVGSSSRISSGSWTSVQASASFCFMPPDSRSASRARNGVSCVIASSWSRRAPVVANAVHLGEERDVLVDGQIAVQTESLREIADTLGQRAMRAHRIEAEHAQFARVGVQQSAHQTDRRRLAGAVRADQAEHLASAHVEAQAGQRRRRAVPLHDAVVSTIAGSRSRDRRSLQCELRVHRHAGLEDAGAVVHADLDAVHELRALFGGLHVARRELGLRRHERDLARQGPRRRHR